MTSGQSYKQFTLVNYNSRVVIWGIFKSGTTLELQFTCVTFFIRLATGLVVMGGGSSSEGRGFKSQRRILDGHYIFSH